MCNNIIGDNMEKEFLSVKNAIYDGMSIYSIIMGSEIVIDGYCLNYEDKKYLSLYLGMINTTKKFSEFLKEKGYNYDLDISYKVLDTNNYMNIYIRNFVDIFKQIPFDSLDEYIVYLLNKDIIKRINERKGYTFEEFSTKSNKLLIKQ